MEEKTTKQICLEQMEICTAKAQENSDDVEISLKYQNEAGKWADRMIEVDKNESTNVLEEKKNNDSKKSKWWEIAIAIVGSIGLPIAFRVYDRNTLERQTRAVCEFEKTNTFTTQAGKGLGSYFRTK